MTLTIEHGIPLPHIRSSELRETISKMRKGDSFVVPDKFHSQRAWHAAHRMGMKVTTAKQNGYYRIWKIK